jgi:hypothetical protein
VSSTDFSRYPKVGGVYEKYEHFAAHRDQYNLLFIGSSRFYHQIVPERFDSRVAAISGALVHSFNFGADGMRPPESFYLLRKILALQPPKLRWVVIEMMEMKTVIRRTNARTLRLAYWHDWQHTRLAWDDVARATWTPSEKCALLFEHGMHFARQSTNLGRGVEWTEKYLSRNAEPMKRKTVNMEGFDPLAHRKMSADDLAEYEIAVLDLRRGIKRCPLHPVLRKALSELIAEIRAAAAEPSSSLRRHSIPMKTLPKRLTVRRCLLLIVPRFIRSCSSLHTVLTAPISMEMALSFSPMCSRLISRTRLRHVDE